MHRCRFFFLTDPGTGHRVTVTLPTAVVVVVVVATKTRLKRKRSFLTRYHKTRRPWTVTRGV